MLKTKKKIDYSYLLRVYSKYSSFLFVSIYIRLLLGIFELHVTTGYTLGNSSTLCRAFHFSGIKQFQTALECVNAIRGDTIVVKKIDEGSLRLFELSPISLCLISKIKKSAFILFNDKQVKNNNNKQDKQLPI